MKTEEGVELVRASEGLGGQEGQEGQEEEEDHLPAREEDR